MIAEALGKLADLFDERATYAAQQTTVQVHDRRFLRDRPNGDLEEILPRFEDTAQHLPQLTFGDIDSLLAWAKATGEKTGIITVGRGQDTRACAPAKLERHIAREEATLRFYAAFMPSCATMSQTGFLAWLEMMDERITDGELVLASARTLKTVSGSEARLVDTGGVVQVVSEKKDGVVSSAPFAKLIKARIPFGDPTFETEVWFFVQPRKTSAGELVFDVEQNVADLAVERWISYAVQRISEGLAEQDQGDWTVLAGA